jgi:peptidoglycan/LPS O-acetylase OafA/YrhL
LVVAETLIGLAALHPRSRRPAVAAGFVLALAIWVVGQNLGQFYSGQATDPNTAPLIALMAIALLGSRARLLAEPGSPAKARRLQRTGG